jgi:hypothetical protein
MQIYLSKPSGQREGPYTVEQINGDLAARKYREADYWAWYEGLESWVPLHSVPGVTPLSPADAAAAAAKPPVEEPGISTDLQSSKPMVAPAALGTEESGQVLPPGKQISSGVPATALEHIFVFTSGEGPATMQSPVTAVMVQEITGEDLESLRARVGRDVFGRCDIGDRLRQEGSVPSSAWRAMSSLKPELVQQARDGAYHICVRTFTVEPNNVVAVFLFYNKQKLGTTVLTDGQEPG